MGDTNRNQQIALHLQRKRTWETLFSTMTTKNNTAGVSGIVKRQLLYAPCWSFTSWSPVELETLAFFISRNSVAALIKRSTPLAIWALSSSEYRPAQKRIRAPQWYIMSRGLLMILLLKQASFLAFHMAQQQAAIPRMRNSVPTIWEPFFKPYPTFREVCRYITSSKASSNKPKQP